MVRYSPEVMRPYIADLARGLLIATTFDREVNVRWAASSAFQEHVGRQVHCPLLWQVIMCVSALLVGTG
jgi:hypothetical protein